MRVGFTVVCSELWMYTHTYTQSYTHTFTYTFTHKFKHTYTHTYERFGSRQKRKKTRSIIISGTAGVGGKVRIRELNQRVEQAAMTLCESVKCDWNIHNHYEGWALTTPHTPKSTPDAESSGHGGGSVVLLLLLGMWLY